MADLSVEGEVSSSTDERGLWGTYWSDKDTGLLVFSDNLSDISFARTTDAGATWVTTEIEEGDARTLAVWYDKETPGDTGTLVHIAWLDSVGGVAFYITVDVSNAAQGTKRTIVSGLTVSTTPSLIKTAITKTVSGNLIFALSTQSEIDCLRSIDSGVNWTDRADPFETATEEDWLLLFPTNTADDSDAVGVFWDRSADEISMKMYDDSANTWTETSISGSMIDDAVHRNMDGGVLHSNGHIYFLAHSDDDSANDDLMAWDLTVDSIASPTVTAKTNIFTDQAESTQVAVVINQQNDDVYVGYLKGGTWLATMDVVYHKSTDGMTTWEAEQAYSENAADDLRILHGGRTVGDDGGRIQFSFYNDDLTEIFVNLTNDIEIVAASGGTDVNATIDTLSITDFDATITALVDINISATLDTLSITNFDTTVQAGVDININATLDALAITNFNTTVTALVDSNINATSDNLTITDFSVTIDHDTGLNILATTDSLSITDFDTVVEALVSVNVSATRDTLSITDFNAVIASGAPVEIDISLTLSANIDNQETSNIKTIFSANIDTVDSANLNEV